MDGTECNGASWKEDTHAKLLPAHEVSVAAIQFACGKDRDENLNKAEKMVRRAASSGANIILLQELFSSPYFPIDQMDCTDLAISPQEGGETYLNRFAKLAKELEVVLPISFFERCHNVFYNSVKVFDSDGSDLGVYRKSHIPDGPGYQEKFYFSPGQSGFQTFGTRFARIGIGICWDQWFPEAARCMVLNGAELLLYPTAIGSEPLNSALDSSEHWRRCMQGHAAANMVPVIASNRIGMEKAKLWDGAITFYGGSFITDHLGAVVKECGRVAEEIVVHAFKLHRIRGDRVGWGLFRDRRPDLYGDICTLDGASNFKKI